MNPSRTARLGVQNTLPPPFADSSRSRFQVTDRSCRICAPFLPCTSPTRDSVQYGTYGPTCTSSTRTSDLDSDPSGLCTESSLNHC